MLIALVTLVRREGAMECVSIKVQNSEGLKSAMTRYDLLVRTGKCLKRGGLRLLAFGVSARQVRFVVDGDLSKMANFVRGVKVGTLRAARARGIHIVWGRVCRFKVESEELLEAVEWAHSVATPNGDGPLTTPWSSHRDLLGYREAPFYDASLLLQIISPKDLHRKLGGGDLPANLDINLVKRKRESLHVLLRVAGAVIGVLPADRKCFRLFAHLAKAQGWRNMDIAHALSLTVRRVRQLLSQPEPNISLAFVTLGDQRLCRVP